MFLQHTKIAFTVTKNRRPGQMISCYNEFIQSRYGTRLFGFSNFEPFVRKFSMTAGI